MACFSFANLSVMIERNLLPCWTWLGALGYQFKLWKRALVKEKYLKIFVFWRRKTLIFAHLAQFRTVSVTHASNCGQYYLVGRAFIVLRYTRLLANLAWLIMLSTLSLLDSDTMTRLGFSSKIPLTRSRSFVSKTAPSSSKRLGMIFLQNVFVQWESVFW